MSSHSPWIDNLQNKNSLWGWWWFSDLLIFWFGSDFLWKSSHCPPSIAAILPNSPATRALNSIISSCFLPNHILKGNKQHTWNLHSLGTLPQVSLLASVARHELVPGETQYYAQSTPKTSLCPVPTRDVSREHYWGLAKLNERSSLFSAHHVWVTGSNSPILLSA